MRVAIFVTSIVILTVVLALVAMPRPASTEAPSVVDGSSEAARPPGDLPPSPASGEAAVAGARTRLGAGPVVYDLVLETEVTTRLEGEGALGGDVGPPALTLRVDGPWTVGHAAPDRLRHALAPTHVTLRLGGELLDVAQAAAVEQALATPLEGVLVEGRVTALVMPPALLSGVGRLVGGALTVPVRWLAAAPREGVVTATDLGGVYTQRLVPSGAGLGVEDGRYLVPHAADGPQVPELARAVTGRVVPAADGWPREVAIEERQSLRIGAPDAERRFAVATTTHLRLVRREAAAVLPASVPGRVLDWAALARALGGDAAEIAALTAEGRERWGLADALGRVASLQDGDRAAAFRALVALLRDDPRAAAALAAAIDGASEVGRAVVLSALATVGDGPAQAALAGIVDRHAEAVGDDGAHAAQGRGTTIVLAAVQLGRVAHPNAESLAALERACAVPGLRGPALLAFGSAGAALEGAARERVRAELRARYAAASSDAERGLVLKALGNADAGDDPVVLAAALDGAAGVREAAARALRSAAGPAARARLVALVDDPEVSVRRRAVESLQAWDGDVASPVFERVLRTDPDASVRVFAASALSSYAARPSARAALEAAAIGDASVDVQAAARAALSGDG